MAIDGRTISLSDAKMDVVASAAEEYRSSGKGLSKVLRLLSGEIRNLDESGVPIIDQAKIIGEMTGLNIDYNVYRMWVWRNIRKKRETAEK